MEIRSFIRKKPHKREDFFSFFGFHFVLLLLYTLWFEITPIYFGVFFPPSFGFASLFFFFTLS